MYFINSGYGYILFSEEVKYITYVDKSLMVDALYRYVTRNNKFVCVTRPRRFGKSVAANMIAAFFDESTTEKSRALFETLQIASLKEQQFQIARDDINRKEMRSFCWPQQGKWKVIRINMIDVLTSNVKSYDDFVQSFECKIKDDIHKVYPQLVISEKMAIPDILEKTGDQFIFVIDEWDAVFEMRYMTEQNKEDYLLFLKALLKDRSYVHFAYMTGLLPIAKYMSGPPLNMFDEFSAFKDGVFYPFFGLTANEIEKMMEREHIIEPPMEEMIQWYDGYIRDYDGAHIFNPQAVASALAQGSCGGYWTGTGPMNEVQALIQNDVEGVRNDIIQMVGGNELEIELEGFSSEKTQTDTRDEILSEMVVYGFLTYYDGKLKIPNYELMLKFRRALVSKGLGLKQTLEQSKALVNATIAQEDSRVARMMETLHDEQIPFFAYNDENSLACVVVVGYLAALNDYELSREEKAGKGFADFLFTPYQKSGLPIILELKYNHSAKNALDSIKKRDYLQRFRTYPRVLLVGINYSERTKKHTCKTEIVESGKV